MRPTPTTYLPFPGLVGLETAQQALLLLAVEPRLSGLILSAPAGTGKSSLARGMSTLTGHDSPFVEAPSSTGVENLLGELDIAATLRTRQAVMRPGVLARAHGGVLHVDGINLMTDTAINLLLATLDRGEVLIERDGISERAPARFGLIGTYDPAEGPPRNHLLDRVGLLVVLPPPTDADQRAAVIRHNLLSQEEDWRDELDFLRGLVLAAREHLPGVDIAPEQIEQLSRTALAYGVEGHRVDLFAVHAARAAAALELRAGVNDDDLALAARLVILPRATQLPAPPPETTEPPEAPPQPETSEETGEETDEDLASTAEMTDNSVQEAPPPEREEADPEQTDGEEAQAPAEFAPPAEEILSALESELPADLEELPFRHVRRGRSGSRGATEGDRGRHVRSIAGDPRRHRIDVSATLRAAAPWQPLRHMGQEATPSAAQDRPVLFAPADLRVKQFRSKAGALFCFAVDASGSMALHRMRQAKGAVQVLLQKAYVKRDRVALLAFRGDAAEVLMPPSQSVELAQRALDLLPTGGGTPLASALLLADRVAQQARGRGILQTVLILLTDGRANVALRPEGPDGSADIQSELQQIGQYLAASSLHVVVVDTQRSYLSRGEARRLAEWLHADYAYLPNASSEEIAALAADSVQ